MPTDRSAAPFDALELEGRRREPGSRASLQKQATAGSVAHCGGYYGSHHGDHHVSEDSGILFQNTAQAAQNGTERTRVIHRRIGAAFLFFDLAPNRLPFVSSSICRGDVPTAKRSACHNGLRGGILAPTLPPVVKETSAFSVVRDFPSNAPYKARKVKKNKTGQHQLLAPTPPNQTLTSRGKPWDNLHAGCD